MRALLASLGRPSGRTVARPRSAVRPGAALARVLSAARPGAPVARTLSAAPRPAATQTKLFPGIKRLTEHARAAERNQDVPIGPSLACF